MDYIEVRLNLADPSFGEILEAELAEAGFESFQLNGTLLQAYIPAVSFDASACDNILDAYNESFTSRAVHQIEHTNWNAVWESNYPPVAIGDELFIAAPFHTTPQGYKHVIVLEPNMSFGTGHHPTTEMMLRYMATLDLNQKSFLDFGCGSGILSIYAALRGAHGLAVEIDPHAAEAARTNLATNSVKSFVVESGGVEKIKGHTFDVIAANINKNVIEECAVQFKACMNKGGFLLCAGFLNADMASLSKTLESHYFHTIDHSRQGDWSLLATKRSA